MAGNKIPPLVPQMGNPFAPAAPTPGVVPAGTRMAMDEAPASQVIAWAAGPQGLYNGAFAQGYTFMGYPYLSELAQVPEYRVISETIATEMTRKWIKFKAAGDVEDDKSERVDELTKRSTELDVRGAFRKVAEQDGFFGRSHLYIDTGHTEDRDELMTDLGNGENAVSEYKLQPGGLYAFRVVEPIWTYPANYDSADPLRPSFYNPTQWFVNGKQVHASRLLKFVGREVPDLLKPAYSFGGLSLSQMAKPYVDNWLQTRQSVNAMIHTFSVGVLSTNLAETLNVAGEDLFARARLFNGARDNQGLMMVDKDTEEFSNVSAPLGTLDHLQAQAQEHMSAVSRIPLVKLLGIQPTGLNADSEGVMRAFYDSIHAYQESFFRSNLTRVMHFMMLDLWGEIDRDITFDFEPLFTLDEKGRADLLKTEAETDVILVDGGIIHTEEARKRVAADLDTPYPGLDVSDVPEEPDPMEGGESGEEGPLEPSRVKSSINVAGGDRKLARDEGEFKEGDHSRAPDGKFGSGGGSAEKPKVNKKREKKARKEMSENLDYTGSSLRATYGGLNKAGTHYEPITDPKMRDFADIAESWANEVANEGAPYNRGPAAAIAYFANNYGLDTGDAVDRDEEVDAEFAKFAAMIKRVGEIKADASNLSSAMDDVESNVTEDLSKLSKPLQKQMDKIAAKVSDEDWFAPGDLDAVKSELDKFLSAADAVHKDAVKKYVEQYISEYLEENPGEEYSEEDIEALREDAEGEVETSSLIESLNNLDGEITYMRDQITTQEAALDAATPKDEGDEDYVSSFLNNLGEDSAAVLSPSSSAPVTRRRHGDQG